MSTNIVRPEDTLEDLKAKVELSTIIGTIQSTFTNFRYLRPIWKKNAEEERLLGVSMTGVYDHSVLSKDDDLCHMWLSEMVNHAVKVNEEWAKKIGINQSVAVTTMKPEGTTSSLVNSGSGIHARHSEYYIRTVRQDNKDPLTQFLKDAGVPWEPCVMRPESTTVFSFPIKSPDGALTRKDITAVDHLNLWMTYNKHWAEHQVSVTVNVKEHEWVSVAGWVYDNFDDITGISFLPYDTGTYKQAPFQECSKEEYEALLGQMPSVIDWSILSDYEKEDATTGVRELACAGGSCEIT